MFHFFKELQNAIREGLDEAKQELAAEQVAIAKQQLEELQIIQQPIHFVTVVLALSCPFRSFFISEQSLAYLYQFSCVSERQKRELAKFLKRDFNIVDGTSLATALQAFNPQTKTTAANGAEAESADHRLFVNSTCLYMITSAVELGYVSFAAYQTICQRCVQAIIDCGIHSWHDYLAAFVRGDSINHGLAKKLLHKSAEQLLTAANSPWQRIDWQMMDKYD